MADPITSITIVGGGTAGWLAATLLRAKCAANIKITLIESPNMPVTLREWGVNDQEFFRRCNASFKMG